jgi:nucleoid-associated protein YgaU
LAYFYGRGITRKRLVAPLLLRRQLRVYPNSSKEDQLSQQIPQGSEYTVQPGDTLSSIAQRTYGNGSQAYWMALYIANQYTIGDNPNVIRPGENLFIPQIMDSPSDSSLYVVKPGDTLYSIAERVSGVEYVQQWVGSIYSTNKQVIGNNPNLIHPGQVLFISAGGQGGGGGHM